MTNSSQKNRIIFIDLIRAFAVLMMVQGHTTDVLLADEYRRLDSSYFSLWYFMRGMTAPVFMFTAGTVFTYLYRLQKVSFLKNPRTKKGFQRFLLLLFIGYLLRYPTPTLIDFSNVSESQWRVFFAVDVLHCIGFGIFFILIFAWISEKTKLGDYLTYFLGSAFFIISFPFINKLNWNEFLHPVFVGYFTNSTGSNFPLFPWIGYLLAGAILGSYLAKNPNVFAFGKSVSNATKFIATIGIIGVIFFLLSKFFDWYLWNHKLEWKSSLIEYSIISMRLGYVLMLTAVVALIALKVNSIPEIVILIGRNTLLIYIVHIIILYGSMMNPGINKVWNRSFTPEYTILADLIMLSLMIGLVYLIHLLKIKNQQLVT